MSHSPSSKINVLLLENIHPLAHAAFQSSRGSSVYTGSRPEIDVGADFESEIFRVEALSVALHPDQLKEKIQDVHVLGIRSKTQVTAEVLAHAHELLTLGCFCIGTNQVDLEAAKSRGIPVFNAPFGNTRSVAEMVIAEIICLARQLGQRSMEMHQGTWRKISTGCYEVRGKVLGIIGYGHIGSQVSTLAEALGMKVIFFDIIAKLPLGNAKSCPTLHELLKQSDFVTLHVPATPQTENLMDETRLKMMKKGAYLINASRGSVVDISAITQLLKENHLHGAAFDVFPEEPESNIKNFQSELLGLNNVMLTPHIGGATEEAQVNIGTEVPAALIRFINSGSTSGAVNFPEVDLVPRRGNHRILNIHKNVPGVLTEINRIISQLNVNIEAQTLATFENIGYLVLDTAHALPNPVKDAIAHLSSSIRTRILY